MEGDEIIEYVVSSPFGDQREDPCGLTLYKYLSEPTMRLSSVSIAGVPKI